MKGPILRQDCHGSAAKKMKAYGWTCDDFQENFEFLDHRGKLLFSSPENKKISSCLLRKFMEFFFLLIFDISRSDDFLEYRDERMNVNPRLSFSTTRNARA
jgi:hypothetical protein